MDKDKNKKSNFKKLLCYNIVNNIKCIYKNKCMFAHNISEQLKEPNRELIHNIIYNYDDLSNVNIKDNKELFDELLIFTKECKNCINKKCPGGFNCKFGVCAKELKICYNDLLNGKCLLPLNEEITNGKSIKRCYHGIHLTEKNLIPYYQRISCEINILDYGIFLFDNVNYYSKINTISVMLNDNTIKFIKPLINKNKITKSDVVKNSVFGEKMGFNFLVNDFKVLSENNLNDDLDDDILDEYKTDKLNNSIDTINDYFWRYKKNTNELSSSDSDTDEKINIDTNFNVDSKHLLDSVEYANNQTDKQDMNISDLINSL